MIKIKDGNLSIKGTVRETTAELLSVLTGYREMLIERCGLTPQQVNNHITTLCDASSKPYARQAINLMANMGNRTLAAEADEKPRHDRNDK